MDPLACGFAEVIIYSVITETQNLDKNIYTTFMCGSMTKLTSPWELMDPPTKNDSDKTQDIRMPYVGNECLTESELNK